MNDNGYGWEIPKERLEKDMQIIHINKDNINQGIDGAKFSEEIKVIFHEKGMPVTIKKMKTKGFGWDMSGAKWQMGIDGLEGKNLSKKGAFEYESDVNIEEFYCKKEEFVYNKQGFAEKKDKKEKEEKEIKCEACQKSFTCEASLKRHLERSAVCVNWNNLPQKIDGAKLTKGIHLLMDELLEKAIGNDGELECKYCKMKFTTKGNHHKHFNTATVCNRLAFQEFKRLFNDL